MDRQWGMTVKMFSVKIISILKTLQLLFILFFKHKSKILTAKLSFCPLNF